jgi:DNA polymerase III subunit epsilon
VLRASPDEVLQHEHRLDALDNGVDGQSVWRRLG